MPDKIIVREFDTLCVEKKDSATNKKSVHFISKKDFNFLSKIEKPTTEFLEWYYKTQQSDKKPPELVLLTKADTLQIRNYVGMIKLPDSGKILEILPKVQITEKEQYEKQKLIQMICTTIAPRLSDNSDFDDNKNDLMEYLIAWFLHHMEQLLKRGVKQNYVMTTENAHFIKGKILFAPDIKYNSTMRHRTFIEYEDYTPDCPENRLLHSALWACIKYTQDDNNKNLANRYCHMFDDIGKSTNHKNDFTKWHDNPTYPEYINIKPIAKLILYGIQPFMSEGTHEAPAILFPMHIVYEKYIAHCLEQYAIDYAVKTQSTGKKLTDKNFALKPDIVLIADSKNIDKSDNKNSIVLDTKWKRYDNDNEISQSDAYQMYAYSQAYNAHTVLLYPKNHAKNIKQSKTHIFNHPKSSKNKKTLQTHITDLDKTPKKIAKQIKTAINETESK